MLRWCLTFCQIRGAYSGGAYKNACIPIYSRTFPDFTRFLRTHAISQNASSICACVECAHVCSLDPVPLHRILPFPFHLPGDRSRHEKSQTANRRKDHLACKSLDIAVISIQIPLENKILSI